MLEWARIPWAGPADPSPVSLRLLFLTDAPQALWLLPPSLQPPSIPVSCHRAVSSPSFCAGSAKSSFLHWKSPSHLLGEHFLKCPMENIPHPWSSHSLIPSRVSLHRTYHCTNSNIYYLFLLTFISLLAYSFEEDGFCLQLRNSPKILKSWRSLLSIETWTKITGSKWSWSQQKEK